MRPTKVIAVALLALVLLLASACGGGGQPSYTTTTYELHVYVNGNGQVSPSGGAYSEGTQITLHASPASGWRFDHWGGDAWGTSASMTITMNSDKSVTAYFTRIQYTLSTSVSPYGSGSVSPGGGTFDAGSQVTLTATPSSGWRFGHWGGAASGTTEYTTITMDSDKQVTAYFVEVNPAIRVVLDKVQAIEDCEPFFMAPGDFYFVVVVTDGRTSSEVRIPYSGNYPLFDAETVNINRVCFSTPEVGDYLQIVFVGFEEDSGICYSEYVLPAAELLAPLLDPELGGGVSILLSLVEGQREAEGFWCDVDDLAGGFDRAWFKSENWGTGSHWIGAPSYLNVWLTIEEW